MRRTRSRHVGRSVLSGATTPNRNGLVIGWNARTTAMSGPVTRYAWAGDFLPTPCFRSRCPPEMFDERRGRRGMNRAVSPIDVAHSVATGAAVATVAVEG